jgi:hypothetical protein
MNALVGHPGVRLLLGVDPEGTEETVHALDHATCLLETQQKIWQPQRPRHVLP